MTDTVPLDLKGLLKGGESTAGDTQALIKDAHVHQAVCTSWVVFSTKLFGSDIECLDEAGETFLQNLLFKVVKSHQEVAIACLERLSSIELLNPSNVGYIDLLTLDLVAN